MKRRPEFLSFLLEKEQKILIGSVLLIYSLILVVISISYEYPISTPDSPTYIRSANLGEINGYRPIGYSWFIGFFHKVTTSFNAIFFFQFVLHVLSTLLFLLTVKFKFKPQKKWLFYLFVILVVVEPNVNYLTNLVMSDSIFNTLTILFITSLFWIEKEGKTARNLLIFGFHLLALYLVLNTRFTALFYLFLTVPFVILLTKKRLVGIGLALLPVFIVLSTYQNTKKEMEEVTGTETFSSFSGWTLANNAVSMIPYIDLEVKDVDDGQMRFVHRLVTSYPDSIYNTDKIMATSFMWTNNYPGKQLLFYNMKQRKTKYATSWVFTGKMLGEYGRMLIKEHPFAYFKYFILENLKELFTFFEISPAAVYKPDKMQQEWYALDFEEHEFKSDFFTTPFILGMAKVFHYLRWLLLCGSLLFVSIRFKKLKLDRTQKLLFFLVVAFVLCFFAFSVVSHPINNYRYLIPTYMFTLFIAYVVSNQMFVVKSIDRGSDKAQ